MLIRHDHPLTSNLPPAFTSSLEEIMCHRKVRSKVWCHDLAWSQNIMDGECTCELVWVRDLLSLECPTSL